MEQYARKINRQTDISDSVLLCVPDSNISIELKKTLSKHSRNVDLRVNPEKDLLFELKKPAILIGNLSDSYIVRDLYFRFLSATDLWYPGPCGYEIRTLLDPYGYGENIIHIGYSDSNGLNKAIDAFIPMIDDIIQQMSIIKPTRLHIHESEAMQIRALESPELVWMNIARNIYKKGYLGYLTGDMEIVEDYLNMWRAIVSYPIVKDDQKIKDLHLKMSNLIQTYRLIETAGLIEDDGLREKITEYILNWPSSDQGLNRIDRKDYTHPEFPRQNHGMIPALGLAFLLDYCRTYGYEGENLNEWEKLIEKAYHPYMSGSWKPVCDGTCHGWWLSQPALLEYGLIDPMHRYFKHSGAKKAADAAMNLVNNNGIMPASGDFNLLRGFPGITLRHAQAFYMDGRYKYVHDLAPMHLASKYNVYMPRMFDTGIKPIEPKNMTGLTITHMDPLIYNSWDKAPELVRGMLDTGPGVPLEKTFDKLAVRTGWSKENQYLLLDGLGNNPSHTHSYPNTLGIIDYYHMGESWIIEESGLKFPESENLSVVTISKDGEDFLIPSFGELIETTETDDEYYIKVRLNNYSGTDWTREITLVKGIGLVIRDTVEFKEEGDYTVTSHLRTPGKAKLANNVMSAKRAGKMFRIKAYCSRDFTTKTHINNLGLTYRNHKGEPMPAVPEEDSEKAWEDRYHTKDRLVTSLDSRVSSSFKYGDRVVFVHTAKIEQENDNLEGYFDKINVSGICRQITDLEENSKSLRHIELEKILGEEVLAYDLLNDRIFVGHGKQSVSCFDSQYNLIWSKVIERDPAYCYWWELDYPSAVEIKAFSHNNVDYIIVGCGDLFVRCLSIQGEEMWRFQYINGVPGRINVFDSDGDDVPEILVGGEIISNRSQCRVLGLDGKLKYELDVEFWTSRLTAYADLALAGERYVALGANRSKNLHLYRTYYDGDQQPKKLLEKRLPGTVIKLELDGKSKKLTAYTSEGFSKSYSFEDDI